MGKKRFSAAVTAVLFFVLSLLSGGKNASAYGMFWMKESGEILDFTALKESTVILHTNDIHGRVEYGKNGSVGIAAVAALKEKCLQAGAEVILLDAGDTFRGTGISNYDQGSTIAAIMNIVGYDAMVSGNHDYEYGDEHLQTLASQMNFPILGVNVINKADNSGLLEPHLLLQKNGVTYGIFGLVTKDTMTINKEENVSNIEVIDPIVCAKMEAAHLKALGADIIIALCHLGIKESSTENSLDLLAKVPEINLLIDGHSHTTLAGCKAANASETTLFVSSGCHLKNIGAVVIDKHKNMTAYSFGKEELLRMGIDAASLNETDTSPYVQGVIQLIEKARMQLPEEFSMVIGDSIVTMSFLPTTEKELIFETIPELAEDIPVTFLMTKQISKEYVYYKLYVRNEE